MASRSSGVDEINNDCWPLAFDESVCQARPVHAEICVSIGREIEHLDIESAAREIA
jgi:hypothetical protein